MKNKLTDLNNHLFAQIERLGDEGMTTDDVQREVLRAAAITKAAEQVLNIANIALKAEKYHANRLIDNKPGILS